jgi:anti-anti-sigma factor
MTATEQAAEVYVTVPGDITVGNSAETVSAAIAEWEEHGRPRRMVLDLSNVQRIDSSGVGALMEIRQRVSKADTRVEVRGLHDSPRRLLDRTGIARLFEISERPGTSRTLTSRSLASRTLLSYDRPAPARRRPRRALWTMVWLCVLVGGLAGIAVASYPAMQRAHAQLEQVPVLGTLMGAMDQRVGAIEQNFKDQFGAMESRLTSHIRSESKRTAKLESRIKAMETAQRETGARIDELQQKLEQQPQLGRDRESARTEPQTLKEDK